MKIFLLFLILATLMVFVRLMSLRFRRGPEVLPRFPPQIVSPTPARILGPTEIKNCWFAAFDHRQGPPDPKNFYEELTVEVASRGSSDTRTVHAYVASPSAVLTALGDGPQDYTFARNLIVVALFDMAVILRAVREQLRELEAGN